MRIPKQLTIDLLSWASDAFGKRRKARRILKRMEAAGVHYDPFKSAREKIDLNERARKPTTLSIAETAALDFVMDQFSRKARRARRELKDD